MRTYLAIGQNKQKVMARAIQAQSPEEALSIAKQFATAIWDIYPLDSNRPAFVA